MPRDTKKKPSIISGEVIARELDKYGFKKSIACDEFINAVKAVKTAIDNARGMLICGAVGCGKTQLMNAIAHWNHSNTSQWVYVKDQLRLSHIRNTPVFFFPFSVYLDDIGTEEKIKEYGNTIDVVGDFIQLYHKLGKGAFFATTNLSSAQLNERYDSRVVDRLLEMCVVYNMKGESKRERIILK